MSAVGLSLTSQICNSNYLLPCGTPKSTWEKPCLHLLKTCSSNCTSFSESCIYLFNKYLFIQQWARHKKCGGKWGRCGSSRCLPEVLWTLIEPQPPTTERLASLEAQSPGVETVQSCLALPYNSPPISYDLLWNSICSTTEMHLIYNTPLFCIPLVSILEMFSSSLALMIAHVSIPSTDSSDFSLFISNSSFIPTLDLSLSWDIHLIRALLNSQRWMNPHCQWYKIWLHGIKFNTPKIDCLLAIPASSPPEQMCAALYIILSLKTLCLHSA